MKVVVDWDLCQSHAVCTREAPEIFELNEETDELIVKQECPAAELREKLENAVMFCPNSALSIEE